MNRLRRWLIGISCVFVAALLVWPVYAHCGKCVGSCKQMVKLMDEGKLTLGQAIETAEKHSKGRALAAHCELENGTLEIEVYCLVGDKLMEVEIDGKTGSVTGMEEKKALGQEQHAEHKEHEKHDAEKP